jgi:hypothetical protein
MTNQWKTMTSIEALWQDLLHAGELGGARRVDETHPCDLYGAVGEEGRVGLLLLSDVALPQPPRLSSVETVTSRRQDGRWSLGIWLTVGALRSPFGQLCQDLVDATREVDPTIAGGLILARLARWRRLLEGSHSISTNELRGLVGELLILRECLDIWLPAEVVNGWNGPLRAPQDFALPGLLVEAKVVEPGSPKVRISSVDQLDATGSLILASVTLATVSAEGPGFTVGALVSEIRQLLSDAHAPMEVLEFDARLAAAGYRDDDQMSNARFRRDDVRFFDVREGFPAIHRADLAQGVLDVTYDIALTACVPFETSLVATP